MSPTGSPSQGLTPVPLLVVDWTAPALRTYSKSSKDVVLQWIDGVYPINYCYSRGYVKFHQGSVLVREIKQIIQMLSQEIVLGL